MFSDDSDFSLLHEFKIGEDEDIKYPPKDSYRYLAMLTQLYANSNFGLRSLQDFKKISIVEVKGYCYGWHFYQAADADLVISADDALVRTFRLSLRRLGRTHVAMGADDGSAQVPGNGLHRPAVHREGNVRVPAS